MTARDASGVPDHDAIRFGLGAVDAKGRRMADRAARTLHVDVPRGLYGGGVGSIVASSMTNAHREGGLSRVSLALFDLFVQLVFFLARVCVVLWN